MKKITIKGISINKLSYPLPRPVEVDKEDPKFDVWNTMMAMRIEWQKDYDELQKYKAIEKELGIDLFALFKALKDGIYIDEYNHGLMYSLIVPHLVHECGQYYFKHYGDFGSEDFGFDEYGKTWALTKEEML